MPRITLAIILAITSAYAQGIPNDAGHSDSLFDRLLEWNVEAEPELNRDETRAVFNKILDDARSALRRAATPDEMVAALSQVLLGDNRVHYESAKGLRDATLAASLLRRRGNCLSTTTLYVLVASELGLPVRMVLIPGHAFARWETPLTRINIETTAGGREVKERHIGICAYDGDVFCWGSTLDENCFLAELYLDSFEYLYDTEWNRARKMLEKGLALMPDRSKIAVLWRLIRNFDREYLARWRDWNEERLTRDNMSMRDLTLSRITLAMIAHVRGDYEEECDRLLIAFQTADSTVLQGEVLKLTAYAQTAKKDFDHALQNMNAASRLLGGHELLYEVACLQAVQHDYVAALETIRKARENSTDRVYQIKEAGWNYLSGKRKEGMKRFGEIKREPTDDTDYAWLRTVTWFHAVTRRRPQFYESFEATLHAAPIGEVLFWIDQTDDLDYYSSEPEFKNLINKFR